MIVACFLLPHSLLVPSFIKCVLGARHFMDMITSHPRWEVLLPDEETDRQPELGNI